MAKASGEQARGSLTAGERATRIATLAGLAALLVFPVLGSQVYFRHDDATLLQWAASFRGSLFDVFSTSPAVNGWGAYRGMDVYYRPTVYVIVLQLVRWFGLRASVLMALSGGAMALTLATYLAVLRRRWAAVAIMALGIVGVLYGGVLYQTFRLAVAYPYLFEMLAIAAAVAALGRKEWDGWRFALVAGAVAAYLMASARQSALVLVPAVAVMWFLFVERADDDRLTRWRAAFVWVSTGLVAAVLALVSVVPEGVLGASGEPLRARVFESFWFYWQVAAGGPRLAILLIALGFVAVRGLLAGAGSVRARRLQAGCVVVACAIGLAFPVAAPWVVLFVGLLAVRWKSEVMVGLGWFWAGLAVFLVPAYYHQAYLLEALLGLSFAIAACSVDVASGAWRAGRGVWARTPTAPRIIAVTVVLVVFGLGLVLAVPKGVAAGQSGYEALAAFVDVNKSTEAMADYLAHGLPSGATVLVLSEEQLGRSNETWRSESLAYRASQVRVMDVQDLGAMVEALGGSARVVPFVGPEEAGISRVYGVAYSPDEVSVFREKWYLREIVDFSRARSSVTIMALTPR